MPTTISHRKHDILLAIYCCEWLETFRQEGEWSRARKEENALLEYLDRWGIIPTRRPDGEINGYLTLDTLGSMI